MKRSVAAADRTVLLPSSFAWNSDARIVSDALSLVPALPWQIAADHVRDCVTTDHRPENLRVLILPPYVLEAVWTCHTTLINAAGDGDQVHLVRVLPDYLDAVHDIDLQGLIEALERVLAVFTLDLPAARQFVSHLALGLGAGPERRAALDAVLAAWKRAGVAC
ncbi:hypothetical protein [Streptomyces sp. NPDC002790]|uniref:hypothetical protein n=1 Tax=Streptomyces sp. NPDC002790 TaxID=3154431 RepID=UPI003332EF05